jgi:hypothetical protein
MVAHDDFNLIVMIAWTSTCESGGLSKQMLVAWTGLYAWS